MRDFEDLEQTAPEQIDPLLVGDKMQAASALLKRCASDLGARFLADLIHRKASTVSNQLAGTDPDKCPSFDLAIALACTHGKFRRALIKLLAPLPDLDPEQAVAEIENDILPTLGECDGKRLRAILKRVKRAVP